MGEVSRESRQLPEGGKDSAAGQRPRYADHQKGRPSGRPFLMSAPDFKRWRAVVQTAAATALPEECLARTIVAPKDRSEHALLQLCRRFPILDQLRVAARTTRRVRFQGDMATLVNMVLVSNFCARLIQSICVPEVASLILSDANSART